MGNGQKSATGLSPTLQAIGLACAAAIGLGVARFGYALILPDMQTDLGWSYSTAGWLNTTNAIGYLAGALMAARLNARIGAFNAVQLGAWMCVLSLALCVVLRGELPLNLARILAGLGAGFAFVGGGFLAARVASQNESNDILLGLFYAGPGFGIALTGMTVPFILQQMGEGSWPLAWGVLAALSAALAIALRLGRPPIEKSVATTGRTEAKIGRMLLILVGYSLYGAGYIGYLTFVIAWVRESGASVPIQAALWITVGIGAMLSPWLWGRLLARAKNGMAFATVTALLAIGTGLVAVSQSAVPLFVSALMVGATFLSVVASTTAFVRRNFPADRWSAGIGAMTVAFGTGQILGPVGVGFLSDFSGGVSAGQWISTGLLAAGATIGFFQRDFESAPKA